LAFGRIPVKIGSLWHHLRRYAANGGRLRAGTMGSYAGARASGRWFVLAGLASAIVAGRADAQSSSVTPYDTGARVPSTFSIIGSQQPPNEAPELVSAAAANDATAVTGLLDTTLSSPDEAEGFGRTALIYAAYNNNAQIAQALMNHGAKLDVRDKLGKTALHWAAERGSMSVLRVLLQAKASVDVQNLQGLTPLMLAARSGQTEAVRLLLQYHADPKINDYTGRDAASWAANNTAIVQALKVAAAR
jgi:hypothetical protein